MALYLHCAQAPIKKLNDMSNADFICIQLAVADRPTSSILIESSSMQHSYWHSCEIMACKLVILILISASVSAEIRTAEFILDKAVKNSKESFNAIACGHKSINSGWKHFSMQADKECQEWSGNQTDAGDVILTGSKGRCSNS